MPEITTVREHLGWSYANLACAHSALGAGSKKYGRINYIIRSRLYKGLISKTMSMGSTFDDEKIKYQYPKSCCYCGSRDKLHMDHLIPRIKGGEDNADNLVWACRSCNSSKGGRDVLRWLEAKERRPSILLLRRYIKLVFRYCEENGLLNMLLKEVVNQDLPFDIMALPYKIDDLENAQLWVLPND